jgi:hypothetical protein
MMNNPLKIVVILMIAAVLVVGIVMISNWEQEQISTHTGTMPYEHQFVKTTRNVTCTENGIHLYTCECGYFYEEIVKKSKGHKFEQWVSVREPAEDAEGLRQRKCKYCDCVQEEAYTVWLMSYEEYLALTPAQQQAFYESFESAEAYFAWLHKEKEDYENNKDQIEIDGGGSLDLGDIIGGNGG